MTEFAKERIPTVKDWENAKELSEQFIKMSNNSNKDTTLFKEKGVIDLCKEKQMRICGQYFSSNCHTKQNISTRNRLQKKFIGNCTGKTVTFGEIPEVVKKIESSLEQAKNNKKNLWKGKKPEVNGSAASIKPTEIEAGEEDHREFYSEFKRDEITEHNTYGVQAIQISTLPLLTEDILPIWRELEKTTTKRIIHV